MTAGGLHCAVVFTAPSLPQQTTWVPVAAQVDAPPASIVMNESGPLTPGGGATGPAVIWPKEYAPGTAPWIPSCPRSPMPQQEAKPLPSSIQVCPAPAAIIFAPEV